MNERSAELLKGKFLIRRVGKLQVVGQTSANAAFEPICVAANATEEQKNLATITGEMVEAFTTRRFNDCIRLAGDLMPPSDRASSRRFIEPAASNFYASRRAMILTDGSC